MGEWRLNNVARLSQCNVLLSFSTEFILVCIMKIKELSPFSSFFIFVV